MIITTFVLLMGVCGPYGCVESSRYYEYPTEAACKTAGASMSDPGPYNLDGYQVPGSYVIGCERGQVYGIGSPVYGQRWSSYGEDPWCIIDKDAAEESRQKHLLPYTPLSPPDTSRNPCR